MSVYYHIVSDSIADLPVVNNNFISVIISSLILVLMHKKLTLLQVGTNDMTTISYIFEV